MKPAIGESESSTVLPPHYRLPLDESFYGLDAEESAFFKSQTGIQDDNELKNHLLEIQAAAYAVHPYPCIRRFAWTKLKISRLFPYKQFLELGKERKGAIFLDIGCCFGNDVRKAIFDGYPAENAIASDLHQEFWDLGHIAFKSTPETFPVPFIAGDAFSPSHLEIVPPFNNASPPTTPVPDLKTLTSLNPLRGHVSAIHASAFFHLFQEAEQLTLARALAALLSPETGSMLFGEHAGLPLKGARRSLIGLGDRFTHSPESWADLWDGEVFEKGTVRVETELRKMEQDSLNSAIAAVHGEERAKAMETEGFKFYWLTWSVTRL
ncbi:hypothetical protein FA95DRAFT_1481572 [Auriscalpium vulgare]|uniref:Uncharacterized protein n=1 Tax=Auriscalpium vulgare TaxID=40419 RepID=A0ACB8SBU5_9AGAM|nr:hypothetical protein FA95DRAFT_1481572 [Auriscalpium vulgare]